MGSRKTSHCGGERGTGGRRGREGDQLTLQFDFHLSHRAPLHCTRPLGTDTTRASWETLAGCTAREQPGCRSTGWCLVMPHQIQVSELSRLGSSTISTGSILQVTREGSSGWVPERAQRAAALLRNSPVLQKTSCHAGFQLPPPRRRLHPLPRARAIPNLPVTSKGVQGQVLPVNYSFLCKTLDLLGPWSMWSAELDFISVQYRKFQNADKFSVIGW